LSANTYESHRMSRYPSSGLLILRASHPWSNTTTTHTAICHEYRSFKIAGSTSKRKKKYTLHPSYIPPIEQSFLSRCTLCFTAHSLVPDGPRPCPCTPLVRGHAAAFATICAHAHSRLETEVLTLWTAGGVCSAQAPLSRLPVVFCLLPHFYFLFFALCCFLSCCNTNVCGTSKMVFVFPAIHPNSTMIRTQMPVWLPLSEWAAVPWRVQFVCENCKFHISIRFSGLPTF